MDVNFLSDEAQDREAAEQERLRRSAAAAPMSSPLPDRPSAPGPSSRSAAPLKPTPPWWFRPVGRGGGGGAGAAAPAPTPASPSSPPIQPASAIERRPAPPPPRAASTSPAPSPSPVAAPPAPAPSAQLSPSRPHPPLAAPPTFGHPTQGARSPWLLALILAAILVASWAVHVVVQARLSRQLASAIQGRQAIARALAATSEAEAAWTATAIRLSALAQLVPQHVVVGQVLVAIEASVLPTVQYTTLELEASGRMILGGTAVSFSDVAEQALAMAGSSAVVTEIAVESANLDPRDQLVHFTIAAGLDPATLRYAAARQ